MVTSDMSILCHHILLDDRNGLVVNLQIEIIKKNVTALLFFCILYVIILLFLKINCVWLSWVLLNYYKLLYFTINSFLETYITILRLASLVCIIYSILYNCNIVA